MQTIEKIDFSKFQDDFGNVIQEFEVVEFDKRSNGEWVEEKRHGSGRQYYNVEGQLYLKYSGGCIKLNMDFDSETCGRCFKIGAIIENPRKIIGNDTLFNIRLSVMGTKKLVRQSYADGTSFYCLQDEKGNWKVEYGNKDLMQLIEQVKREIEVYSMTTKETRSHIYDEIINNENELLNKLMEHV
ncbi:hypothetical protein D3C73_278260 [compost metagenome]